MVVLQCPDCHGHSEGIVAPEGEVYFACDYCHYSGYYTTVPEQNYGKNLLAFSFGEMNSYNYTLMTVRIQDSRVTYFVLSNTEVLYEGQSMSEASRMYSERLCIDRAESIEVPA